MDTTTPALVLIDVQKGFSDLSWGTRNNPEFEMNLSALLHAWRRSNSLIFHIQHLSTRADSPLRPNQEGVQFMDFARPQGDEPVITKNVNSAFIGTQLEARLKAAQVQRLVIAGLTTDHCVSTSVRMARNIGFEVVVPYDATATFDRRSFDGVRYDADTVHRVSLASLNHEFAELMVTKELLVRVLK